MVLRRLQKKLGNTYTFKTSGKFRKTGKILN